MAVPWTELGASLCLASALVLAATCPVPTIAPADAEAREGRTVVVEGFARDVEEGTDGHRGIIVLDDHGVPFTADGGEAPREGDWVALRGTLHRDHGRLVLHVEPTPWN